MDDDNKIKSDDDAYPQGTTVNDEGKKEEDAIDTVENQLGLK